MHNYSKLENKIDLTILTNFISQCRNLLELKVVKTILVRSRTKLTEIENASLYLFICFVNW